ncbi:MAG TPA: TonB-dependent receptor plug domain-containing protein, partial [Bacteroidales bacterium]|nr:TonB-dependent receptor plug domain-containing protein [Bacteroidales bacterium]
MRNITILLVCMLFAFQAALAQRTITGTVISSEDGSGIPGATVVVQGTTMGTTTDMAGKYQLTVPDNARVLEFSFIGMKRVEVMIGNQVVINVTLEPDVVDIEGVVVTALGIEREQRSIGFSLQEIGGDVIGQTGNPNLVTSLQGKVAGMEVRQSSGMPGAAATILIRGARSFSGNNQPLVVVDGMPIRSTPDIFANVIGTQYTQRLLDINPNDIENITVLKGQAAAALYGMEAFNGVLVITTKSGRGQAIGRPVVS